MTPDLESLELGDLKRWLADRLNMRGPAAADVDRRTGEAPYDRPLALWQGGDDRFRRRLAGAVRQLLRELKREPWDPEPLHNLMTLIEQGEMTDAVKELADIAYSHAWMGEGERVERHMLVLRTLLGLGSRQTPQFWLDEGRRMGARYPELVFRGLAAHGLGLAFDYLPELAPDPMAVKRITGLFPRLIEREGLECVREMAAAAMGRMKPAAAAHLSRWFPSREFGSPLVAGAPRGTGVCAREVAPEVFSRAGMTREQAAADRGWGDDLVATGASRLARLRDLVVPPAAMSSAGLGSTAFS